MMTPTAVTIREHICCRSRSASNPRWQSYQAHETGAGHQIPIDPKRGKEHFAPSLSALVAEGAR